MRIGSRVKAITAVRDEHGCYVADVALVFDPRSPLEVRASFIYDSYRVEWFFARELLVFGLDGPAGLGDIRIAPFGADRLAVVLIGADDDGHDHTETVYLSRRDVEAFVARTCEWVPLGAERVDVDAGLALPLGGDRR